MGFIPVPDVVQARINWQEDNGVVAQNVFYNATTGVPTLTDLENIGTLWAELLSEGLMASVGSNWRIESVSLRAMNEEEGLALTWVDGFPLDGTVGSEVAPDNVSYTVTWSTGLIGRSARGRTYGLGVPMSIIADHNRLSDVGRLSLNGYWNGIREGFETAGHALQVVSFQEGGVPRTAGRPLPALVSQVRFPLATQRRRLS